jgi:hypothetical protein
LLILFGSPPVSWWDPCCSSYSVHLRCLGGAHVAHLIRFLSGVLVGPVLLILFGSPPVSWWGPCSSSYSVHLRCLGGDHVAHLIRFTSGILVGPVLLILFGSPPVFWWVLCCSSYSEQDRPHQNTRGEPNKMSNTGPTKTPEVNRIR